MFSVRQQNKFFFDLQHRQRYCSLTTKFIVKHNNTADKNYLDRNAKGFHTLAYMYIKFIVLNAKMWHDKTKSNLLDCKVILFEVYRLPDGTDL